MPPATAQHKRAHNILLINNILNQTSNTSPFTLVLDTLAQSGRPLINESLRRAKVAKTTTTFISFETLKKPDLVDNFVQAWTQQSAVWLKSLTSTISIDQDTARRSLIVIDSLNLIADSSSSDLLGILSSLIQPRTSLVAVYHADVPNKADAAPYAPSPLDTLSYLATTIVKVHCLPHVLACKAARDRSVVEPSFGLDEGIEGVLQGLGSNHNEAVVLEMEHRRKSGRGVKEWYVLHSDSQAKQNITFLDDYPGYRTESADVSTDETPASTFELSLTERQRQDREGVVLPYFDAQKGNEEGGRILYDMGSEDDFDEEEDEI